MSSASPTRRQAGERISRPSSAFQGLASIRGEPVLRRRSSSGPLMPGRRLIEAKLDHGHPRQVGIGDDLGGEEGKAGQGGGQFLGDRLQPVTAAAGRLPWRRA